MEEMDDENSSDHPENINWHGCVLGEDFEHQLAAEAREVLIRRRGIEPAASLRNLGATLKAQGG
jgi:hypothetical protein